MRKPWIESVTIAFCLFFSADVAFAEYVTFTDRTEWIEATQDVETVDFNDLTSDWFIESGWEDIDGPYDAGPFTISEIGSQVVDTFLDAPPYIGGYGNIDGTTYLRSDLQGSGTRVTELSYDAPIFAWGTDARSYFDSFSVIYSFDGGDAITVPTPTSNSSFFGIVSTDSFSVVTMTGSFAGLAGFDNISISYVPEPTGMPLVALGLVGLLASTSRRHRE